MHHLMGNYINIVWVFGHVGNAENHAAIIGSSNTMVSCINKKAHCFQAFFVVLLNNFRVYGKKRADKFLLNGIIKMIIITTNYQCVTTPFYRVYPRGKASAAYQACKQY